MFVNNKKKKLSYWDKFGQHKCQYQYNELAKIGHKYAVFLWDNQENN